MAWSPDLIQLFEDTEKCITSSPIMECFYPSEPLFLKTYWSTEGMAWILIQPTDGKESNKSANKIIATGECNFDLEKKRSKTVASLLWIPLMQRHGEEIGFFLLIIRSWDLGYQ